MLRATLVLAVALVVLPGTTRAAPDVDGAIDSLIATFFDPAGGVNSEHSIQVLQQWMREGCAL